MKNDYVTLSLFDFFVCFDEKIATIDIGYM